MAFNSTNHTVSSICKLATDEDVCGKLQKKTKRIFNYFEVSEAGLIYFMLLFFLGGFHIIGYSSFVSSMILLNIGLIPMLLYSICLQVRNKIYCPICLFVDFVIVAHLFELYFSYSNNVFLLADYFASFFLLVLVFFVFSAIVSFSKLLNQFRKASFRHSYTIKEIILDNVQNISSNFKNIEFDSKELERNAIGHLGIFKNKVLLVIINILCPSCIRLVEKIKCLGNSNYDIKLVFQLDNIDNNSGNSILENCIMLSIIMEDLGVDSFSKSLLLSYNRDNSIEELYKITKSNNLNVSMKRRNAVKTKIMNQNVNVKKNEIMEFPFIINNGKRIPSYIYPSFYPVLI